QKELNLCRGWHSAWCAHRYARTAVRQAATDADTRSIQALDELRHDSSVCAFARAHNFAVDVPARLAVGTLPEASRQLLANRPLSK
ncbi:hypothetical protein, partial [Xanthomonas perforans]|uniref:hypothetical protein n=1 Tax=Xanthomonas perforans TaxID=442694 RepID=UPI001F2C304C